MIVKMFSVLFVVMLMSCGGVGGVESIVAPENNNITTVDSFGIVCDGIDSVITITDSLNIELYRRGVATAPAWITVTDARLRMYIDTFYIAVIDGMCNITVTGKYRPFIYDITAITPDTILIK